MTKEIIKSPEEYFRKHKVSVDHDGVMADSYNLVVEKFNNLFKTDYIATDLRDYHDVSVWAMDQGMEKEDSLQLEKDLWFGPDNLIEAKPLAGAIEFMRWFYERGIEVPVITSRLPELEQSTHEWYEKYMPFVKKENIYIRQNDEMDGWLFKVYAASHVSRSAFHFDDSRSQTEALLTFTNVTVGYLSNLPLNIDFEQHRLIDMSKGKFSIPTMEDAREKILKHVRLYNVAQY